MKTVISIEYDSRYWYIIYVKDGVLLKSKKTNKGKPNCRAFARRIAQQKGVEFVESLGKKFLPVNTRKPKDLESVPVPLELSGCPECGSHDWETGWEEATDTVECKCLSCGHVWWE